MPSMKILHASNIFCDLGSPSYLISRCRATNWEFEYRISEGPVSANDDFLSYKERLVMPLSHILRNINKQMNERDQLVPTVEETLLMELSTPARGQGTSK